MMIIARPAEVIDYSYENWPKLSTEDQETVRHEYRVAVLTHRVSSVPAWIGLNGNP